MERNDIQGVERAPESVNKYLLLKGGKNIYGEANYRLVWVANRMRKRGGRFQDWPTYMTSQERGGVVRLPSGLVVPSSCRPDRVVTEVRNLKKYVWKVGWILERWVPSTYYGGEAEWYARTVPDTNIPFGGPYPVHGDFELVSYTPTLEIPTITELQNAIERCEKSRDKRHVEVGQMLLEDMNEAQDAYDSQVRAEREESQAMMRDVMSPLHSTRLSAGAFRTKVAERAGIRSHQGN